MNEFARDIYLDMKPVDRVLLLVVKLTELFDLQAAMDDRDMKLLKKLVETEAHHG